MITDADIKKLKLERFTTKEELEKLDNRTAEGFADVQGQLNEIKTDLAGVKTDVSEIKNTLIDMKDYIYGELHNLRIENKVTANYRPKIENHEQRITKIESVVFAD